MPNLAPYAVKDMAEGGGVIGPEGAYRLRVNGFKLANPMDEAWKEANPRSKAKEPYLQADLIVQDETMPDANGTEVPVFGRHLFVVLTFKRGGDFMLRQFIEACGRDNEWMLVDEHGEGHWDDLKDSEVMANVVTQKERPNPDKPGENYPEKSEVKKFFSVL